MNQAVEPAPTSLEAEKAQQSLWRLLPRFRGTPWFDQLLANEFLPPDVQERRQLAMLQRTVARAFETVPYYGDRFQAAFGRPDIGRLSDLARLPVLTRLDIQAHFDRMQSTALKPGQPMLPTQTSGSTGQPVTVLHTVESRRMFGLLKQRELRWFRWNPEKTLAAVRSANEIPFSDDNRTAFENTFFCQTPHWPVIGSCFHTGPFCGMSCTAPLETQVRWLDHVQPHYLMVIASKLEHLAFGYQQRPVPETLEAALSISQELTPRMRAFVEAVFRVPVHQNYGINEVGIIASRCPEGGRYHVNTELCVVEIVDADGQPCKPGQKGRLLVTALANDAMPLIRYDTGDLAEAMEGPCPCGRTLPSFGMVHGRYNSIVSLPDGYWNYWIAFVGNFSSMPSHLMQYIRQFQMHLFRDNIFELRLALTPGRPEALIEYVKSAWRPDTDNPPAMRIVEVDGFPEPANGKFQMFTSDYITQPPIK
ncbi:phenylacetate--CoA ligase family protein [Desulfosudis oleivorans]|uniref:phenylacetate--CoA ligase family protein n=1 Tax=Desulfosudis oleivorans TaxID=181663 RepID=UPI0000ED8563|nr:AMP-binding protein [Desulfosudis oleivorans]